jgi:signal transduction histidine kinase/ligand-binding sensor domain-containing protein
MLVGIAGCSLAIPAKRVLLALLLAGILLQAQAFAQDLRLNFRYLTDEQGISNNTVIGIAQDDQGYMWFATEGGLNRFDGANVDVYLNDPANPNSLASNVIHKMLIGSDGRIWLAHGYGVDAFDPETEQFAHYYYPERGPSAINTTGLMEDSKGTIWVGHYTKLYFLEKGSQEFTSVDLASYYEQLENVEDQQNVPAGYLSVDNEDRVWLGTDTNGLLEIDVEDEAIRQYLFGANAPSTFEDEPITLVFQDSQGQLWIGTERELGILDTETGHFTSKFGQQSFMGSPTTRIFPYRQAYEDLEGRMWFATDYGLLLYDRKRATFALHNYDPSARYGLASDRVGAVYVSPQGILWAGHDSAWVGYARLYHIQSFSHYAHNSAVSSSLASNFVTDLREGSNGDIWIGTDVGVDHLDRDSGTFTHYLSGEFISFVYEDSKNNVWVGTLEGQIIRRARGEDDFIPINEAMWSESILPSEDILIHGAFEDSTGRLWLGGLGLYEYDPEKDIFRGHFAQDFVADYDFVRAIAEGQDQHLWLATSRGAILFNPETGESKSYVADPQDPTSISSNNVWDIYLDRNKNLWIATFEGLNRGTMNAANDEWEFSVYRTTDGLPDDVMWSIREDEVGNLWLGTNNGLSQYDQDSDRFTSYTILDGLPSNAVGTVDRFGVSHDSFLQTQDGTIFFGGPAGICRFHPKDIVSNNYVPDVDIRHLYVFNRSVPLGPMEDGSTILTKPLRDTDSIRLSYKHSVFSLEFVALDFADPQRNLYAHKMEGVDKDWIYTDAMNRIATYQNLPGGTYTFKVRAANNEGVWNNEGASLRITIVPPIWATWPFRLALIAFMIGLVVAGVRFQTRSVRNRNRALAAVNERLSSEIVEREQLETQLRESQKMEAVGQLAGGVAHDFNNILHVVRGYSELAVESMDSDDNRRDYIKQVLQASKRAEILVRQLLTFSRRDITEPQSLNLNRLIDDLTKMLRRIIEENIELNFDMDADLQQVRADPNQLEQILMNLCLNARDAIGENGKITIRTKNFVIDDAFCHEHPWTAKGEYVLLDVADNGTGMQSEVLEHVFEPFYTTKAPDRGTGLGLATVYGIVKRHQGYIHARSEVGKGTVFSIYLPVFEEPALVAEPANESVAVDCGGSETILLAEDDELVRGYAVQLLEGAGYRVIVARDGGEATDLFDAHAENIDFALLDIIMPKKNGPVVYDHIRAKRPALPILFATGYGFNALDLNSLPKDAAEVVQKPYSASALLAKIRTLLDR